MNRYYVDTIYETARPGTDEPDFVVVEVWEAATGEIVRRERDYAWRATELRRRAAAWVATNSGDMK